MDFFREKGHEIVPSAPIVIKNDPTLMFTNAGMNQFKDIFLDNKESEFQRVTDTQKCLRVSGKHNDLEEVGHDTYHHTMFEMLGNWSFGDYFKKEAIEWAWELLTEVYKIDPNSLYITIFKGEPKERLEIDSESEKEWKKYIDPSHILPFGKKDNFWEMGETGPCGPCCEIHIDLRSESEKGKISGAELVNSGHPEVIELWNLVFIQYNRKSNGDLESLPKKHVDTGMGFERLCMVMENKTSNYDTGVFEAIIQAIEQISGVKYGKTEETDIAIRVISDHIRAIAFAITDGQLPSNTGAGYVIRRILRRAVRYGVSNLNFRDPFLFKLLPTVAEQFKDVFPELYDQVNFVKKVILEEENSFIKTLYSGLKRLEEIQEKLNGKEIPGKDVFELYDTYGFPADLTRLIAMENGLIIDEPGFDAEMNKQKERSRQAAQVEASDWTSLAKASKTEFVGYDEFETDSRIMMFRNIVQKNKKQFQIVLNKTPFYAESGGQTGDTGELIFDGSRINVLDTKKENELIIHYVDQLPEPVPYNVTARIDLKKRLLTANNHSATHLMNGALKRVLGNHIEQKGSFVGPDHFRFDFSHFEKMSPEEIDKVETLVNEKIWENIKRGEEREIPLQDALDRGVTALFGEKYGDTVRVITFDPDFSQELCGGTHVGSTGSIGLFKIITESAIAAGVRRIEAVTGGAAYSFFKTRLDQLNDIGAITKNTKDLVKAVENLVDENRQLKKTVDDLSNFQVNEVKKGLLDQVEAIGGINFIGTIVEIGSANAMKAIAFQLKNEIESLFLIIGATINGKAFLTVMVDEKLSASKDLDASKIIREISPFIKGGGGGQAHFATAGGKNPDGLSLAILETKNRVEGLIA